MEKGKSENTEKVSTFVKTWRVIADFIKHLKVQEESVMMLHSEPAYLESAHYFLWDSIFLLHALSCSGNGLIQLQVGKLYTYI